MDFNKIPKPTIPIEKMTPEQLREFRNSLDPDSMGFVGTEGVEDNA